MSSRLSGRKNIRIKYLLIGAVTGVASILFYIYGIQTQDDTKIVTGASVVTSQSPSFVNMIGTNTPLNQESLGTVSASINKHWFLLGDEFAAADQLLSYQIELSKEQAQMLTNQGEFSFSYKILNSNITGTLKSSIDENTYQLNMDTQTLAPGTYQVQTFIVTASKSWQVDVTEIYVSYPVYVTWTIDWEGYNVEQKHLDEVNSLIQKHNNIPLTHFFNPRIYTSPNISDEQSNHLTEWVIRHRDNNHHAIGLHLHMFPEMVEAAGVTPIENPLKWGDSRDDGYDVLTSQYSYDEMVKILTWAQDIFQEKGLGTPVMYRAGGWYADEEILEAVQDAGFVLDSSGRTAYSFGSNNTTGLWNLSVNTMPYRPDPNNQNVAGSPGLKIWEFPNNGGDSWSFTGQEMIDRFDAVYSTSVTDSRRIVTYLSHLEWFDREKGNIDGVLDHTDQFLYLNDHGPVVYTTLENAYNIWK